MIDRREQELDRWFSGKDLLLLLQRTGVGFSALTPVTPSPWNLTIAFGFNTSKAYLEITHISINKNV